MTPGEPGGEDTLRRVIEALAPLERAPGSEDERRAAEWIAERLRATGCTAAVEPELFHDGYARHMRTLAAISGVAGIAALVSRRLRPLCGLVAAASAGAIADDVHNGPRLFRRAVGSPRTTWNVVATCGSTSARRTLVVLAHHDAAPTGRIFDPAVQTWVGERFPALIESIDTSVPLWWALLAAPALVAAGTLRRRRRTLLLGVAASALGVAVFHDVATSPTVPGANDNLSAVAVLVALAERLSARPPGDLRVMLVSCGAEEVIQGGIYGFACRHFPALPPDQTWFLNLETVGSPRLILLEGEGPVKMEDYHDARFRDLIERTANLSGVALRRGIRARTSTDAVVPHRAGYPTATLASVDRHKLLSNYHLMSDTPENLDYETVTQALALTEAVAHELVGHGRI